MLWLLAGPAPPGAAEVPLACGDRGAFLPIATAEAQIVESFALIRSPEWYRAQLAFSSSAVAEVALDPLARRPVAVVTLCLPSATLVLETEDVLEHGDPLAALRERIAALRRAIDDTAAMATRGVRFDPTGRR